MARLRDSKSAEPSVGKYHTLSRSFPRVAPHYRNARWVSETGVDPERSEVHLASQWSPFVSLEITVHFYSYMVQPFLHTGEVQNFLRTQTLTKEYSFAGIQNGKCYNKCMAKWAKKHCPSNSNAGLMQRSEDTETTEAANESAIVERDVQGDNHDNHHCNNDSVQRKCRWKASWHVFDKEKHYNRCIQKCVRKHNGDNYDQAEEEGDALLTKRSEAVDEATTVQDVKLSTSTEDEGDKGPCDTGTWAEVWCGVKSNWHWNRQTAYEKCIDKCLREHRSDAVVTKRSDNETTDNNTTIDTSKLASTTVSLSMRTDFPYNGQLGEANDNDNHHCNNTWVQIKCSAKTMWYFWAYKKHFFECIAECVAKRNGDNWTEEDAGCDGEEQVKL